MLKLLFILTTAANALGFYGPEKVPAKVKQARHAVLSLIVLSSDENNYTEITTAELSLKQKQIAKNPSPKSQRVAQALKLYLENCRGQIICRAPLNKGILDGGSAVLIGEDGKEMWTAAHVFENGLKEALKLGETNDVRVLAQRRQEFKVLVFDANDKLVAHPFNNHLRLTYAGSPNVIPRLKPQIEVDHLKFEFTNAFAKGLVVGPVKAGEKSFAIGFPACTGCAAQYATEQERLVSGSRAPYPDAGEFDQRFTFGQVLAFDAEVIVTDNDAHGGMSGGATLDEDGRVIGINSAVNVEGNGRRLLLSRPSAWNASPLQPRT